MISAPRGRDGGRSADANSSLKFVLVSERSTDQTSQRRTTCRRSGTTAVVKTPQKSLKNYFTTRLATVTSVKDSLPPTPPFSIQVAGDMFKKWEQTAHSVFNRPHDPLCIGAVAWGACDCEMISRIREDERRQAPSCADEYARGYLQGRKDASKDVKRHLKKFKKSFRKAVASAAKGH